MEKILAQPAVKSRRRFNLFGWLLAQDARYREKQRLKRCDDRLLRDMGMTRRDADNAFLQRFGDNRFYARDRG